MNFIFSTSASSVRPKHHAIKQLVVYFSLVFISGALFIMASEIITLRCVTVFHFFPLSFKVLLAHKDF